MKSRPLSVTIIGWYLILSALLSLYLFWTLFNNPQAPAMAAKSSLSASAQTALAGVGFAVALLCGIGILKGMNWARFVYVGWSVIGLAIGLATSPVKSVVAIGIVVVAIITFFLFREPANAFFAGRPGDHGDGPANI